MNLARLARHLTAFVHAADNHSSLGLEDAHRAVSHDGATRLLHGGFPLLALLIRLIVRLGLARGYLIVDDIILEKWTRGLSIVSKLKDTKTGGFVLGLSVVLVCWSDGKRCFPILFAVYKRKPGVTKTDLAISLLRVAKRRLGLEPAFVLFDSWYASKRVLLEVRALGWHFVTRLRKNRVLDGVQLKKLDCCPFWSRRGCLRGGIEVIVYRSGSKFYASSDLNLSRAQVLAHYRVRSLIEEVIRVLKQELGWQGCQLRSVRAYSRHLTVGVLAFLWLERVKTRRSCSVYKLRRRLISGRARLSEADALDFLTAA